MEYRCAAGTGHYFRFNLRRLAALLLVGALLLAGCSEFDYASDRHLREGAIIAGSPDSHTVQRGDTLYQIAWAHGVDFRDLAAWNGIAAPYVIYPGQRLTLRGQPRSASRAVAAQPAPPAGSASSATSAGSAVRAEPLTGPIAWQWPVEGQLVRRYNPDALGRRGIGIAGTPGSTIKAAAAGDVVYSGSGLRGYGNLVIIKHSEQFLTAYGYNSELLVAEGQRVAGGDAIARMGSSGNRPGELHFEIRERGQPVNPSSYLP